MAASDVVAALVGAAALHVFYRVVEAEWPQAYHSIEDLSRYLPSTSPVRYFVFRYMPLGLASFLVAGLAFSQGRSGWAAGLLVAFLHVLSTIGRAIVQGRLWRAAKKTYLIFHVLTAIALMVAGAIGSAFAAVPATWVALPRFEDASTELWTALIAGFIGAFFVKVTTRRDLKKEEVVARAKKRLGTRLLDHAHETGRQYGADPLLVEAVMVAESLQRARWFRILERRFGSLLGAKSYGVMQVPNSQPMSDEQSVLEAVKLHFNGLQFTKDESGWPVYEDVHDAALRYNRSSGYADLVASVYFHLLSAGSV